MIYLFIWLGLRGFGEARVVKTVHWTVFVFTGSRLQTCFQLDHSFSNPPVEIIIKKNHHKMIFYLAGLGGFEPPKCQSQSLVPYRLATAQY